MSDPTLKVWGANIRRARGGDQRHRHDGDGAHHLTREDLAASIGVAESTISRWERGQREPSRKHKAALAVALGTTVADLFPYPESEGEVA